MSGNCRYIKQKKQVSYDGGLNWSDTGDYRKGSFIDTDSPQCGYDVVYRWVNIDKTVDYYCQGTDKYYKQKKQVSYDGGTTYADVSPAEYRQGGIAERNSVDCGGQPQKNYFKCIALENCKFFSWENAQYLQYSLDSGRTWVSMAGDTGTTTVRVGNEIWWKGNLENGTTRTNSVIETDGRFNIEGNIMSLVYGDDFEGQTDLTGKEGVFKRAFWFNHKLISAENLILPATTLSKECYRELFYNCESLTKAPALPATTLAVECYYRMFELCKSLTSAPNLPATTLAPYCYQDLFAGCTSLTSAPELPATILSEGCYQQMFWGCTGLTAAPVLSATTLVDKCYYDMFTWSKNLRYIKCLATDISATNCTYQWVQDVSTSGTFVKDANTTWPTGDDGIPSGWTVQNA